MGFSDFWLQFNNGKKEQLKDVGHGVRKEQLDPKFASLFEFFDQNGDGVLEEKELQSIFDNIKNFAGDNVLDSAENSTAKSIFADQIHLKDADLQGFVKSVSDASKEIVSSEEKATPDGGKEIKTEYKDGTISTITYYPNGDFKREKLVRRYIETKYVLESPDGKETYLTKEEYDKALKDIKYMEGKFNVSENFSVDNAQTTETNYNKELEDTLIKPHSNVPNEARGIASTNISEGSKLTKITNEIEEPIEQVFSPRALAESLGVNLNTEDGKKILERLSHFDRNLLKILKDGAEVKELLTSNDLTPTFDNISNVLEIVYGITLRTEKELEASKPQMEKLINQIRTAEFLTDFYSTVAGLNDQYTDSLGLFGLGAEGIGYLINKLGLDGENHYQWADSCREFAKRASDLKVLNPEKFNEGFKKIYGENSDKWGIDFNEQAFKDLFALIESGKAVNNNGEFTDEYKAAILKAVNFVADNPNESTFNQVMNGLGETIIMIVTLGWGAETKAGQMLASSTYSAFSRAGVAIASKQVNNKLLQGTLRFAGNAVKLIGPAINEGTKMYTYSLVMGTGSNVANRSIKFNSEENSLEKFVDTEAMVLDNAKGSFGFGAFAGAFGSTVTQKVMQRASRVSQKVGTALADKFAKGAVDANEVFTTILEKSAPTKIAEVAAFVTDVLGFTAFESVLAIVNNLDNFPDGYSVEDLTNIIWEELKSQGYNLGQIKIVAWFLSSRSARMQASKYMRENPQFKGATVEKAGEGFKINLPDGRKVECKNTTEMITAMHLISRDETALSKIFDKPKTNAQGVNEGGNGGTKPVEPNHESYRISIPIRLKSKMHDEFHATGNAIYYRMLGEWQERGLTREQMIREEFDVSKFSDSDWEQAYTWLDKIITNVEKIDKSFDGILPSLTPATYYRGMIVEPDSRTMRIISDAKPGDVIVPDTGYAWGTPNEKYAEDFAQTLSGNSSPEQCVIMKIKTGAGVSLSRDINISLDNIELNPYTNVNVVFRRMAQYRVLEKEIKDGKVYITLEYLGVEKHNKTNNGTPNTTYSDFTQKLYNIGKKAEVYELSDGRKVVKVKSGLVGNKYDFYEFDSNGNLTVLREKVSGKEADRIYNNFEGKTPQTIKKGSGTLSMGGLGDLTDQANANAAYKAIKETFVNGGSTVVQTVYGPLEYTKTTTQDGQVTSSLVVSRQSGVTIDILKGIPQETLQSPVIEHVHQVQCSTINPEVGIVITQNESKPVLARKITTEGTLENCLVENNSNNIPLKYDVETGTMYADTPWNPGRQDITGHCLQVTYGTVVESWGARPEYIKEYAYPETGEAPDVGTLAAQKESADRSFMPADIAGKQYEIVTESGERIPCNYEDMVPGVDYKISKKSGVELKMAVPPTEVTSSEGETLPAGKLYMVDSDGHFYNGNPIKRIKSGEVNWNADMNDPVQVKIKGLIDESLKLEADSKAAKQAGNVELSNELSNRAKQVTAKAEQEMTDWVRTAQNKKGVDFFKNQNVSNSTNQGTVSQNENVRIATVNGIADPSPKNAPEQSYLIETFFETMSPDAAEKVIYNSIIHNSEENVEKFHGHIYPKSLLSYCEIDGKVSKELVDIGSELLLKFPLGSDYKVMTIMDLFKTKSGIDRLAIKKFKELSTRDYEKDEKIADKLKSCKDSQGRFREDYYSKLQQIRSPEDKYAYWVLDACKVNGDIDESIWAKAVELKSLGFSSSDIWSLIKSCRTTDSSFEIIDFSDELYQRVLDLKQNHNVQNGEISQIIDKCKTKDGAFNEEKYNFAIELSSHIDNDIANCAHWLIRCENKEELFNRLDEMKNQYGIKDDYQRFYELSCDIIQDGKVVDDTPWNAEYTLRFNKDKFKRVMNLASELNIRPMQLQTLIKYCYKNGKFDEATYNTILNLYRAGMTDGFDLQIIGDCIYKRDRDDTSIVNHKLMEKLAQWFTSYVEIKSAQEPNKDINIIKNNARIFVQRMIGKINNTECEATEYIQKFIDAGLIDNIGEILEVASIKDNKANDCFQEPENHYDKKVMDRMLSLQNKYKLDSEDVNKAINYLKNNYEVEKLTTEEKITYFESLDKLFNAFGSPKDLLEQIKKAELTFELNMIVTPECLDSYTKYMKQGVDFKTIDIVNNFSCPEKYKDNPDVFIDKVLSFINSLPEEMQKYPRTLCHLEEWADIITETVKQNNNEQFIKEYMHMLQYQIATYELETPEFRQNVIHILECAKEHPDKLREIETVLEKTGYHSESDYEIQEVCLKNIDRYEDILGLQQTQFDNGVTRTEQRPLGEKRIIAQLDSAGVPIDDALKIVETMSSRHVEMYKKLSQNYLDKIVELCNEKKLDEATLNIIKIIHPYDTKNVEILDYLLDLKDNGKIVPDEPNISQIGDAIARPHNYIYDNYKEIIDFIINTKDARAELKQKLSIDDQDIISNLIEACKYRIQTYKEDANAYVTEFFCDAELMHKIIKYANQGIILADTFKNYCYTYSGYDHDKLKSLVDLLDKVDLEKYKDEVNLILSETSEHDVITNPLLTKEKWEYILDLQKLLIEQKGEGQNAPVLQAGFFNAVAKAELSDIAINRLRFYIENKLSIPDDKGYVNIDSLLISDVLMLYTLRPDKIEIFEDILFNIDNTNLLHNLSHTKEVLDKQLELYEKLIELNIDKQHSTNIFQRNETLENICAMSDVFDILRANTNYKNRKKMNDTIIHIVKNTNSLNIEVTKEALNLGYAPEQIIILGEVNENNKDLIIDWMKNKILPINELRAYANNISTKEQADFANRLLKERILPSYDSFESIMSIVKGKHTELAEFLCFNKELNFPLQYVGEIVFNCNDFNIDLVKQLCTDKDLDCPIDLISVIAKNTNKSNIELAERLCTDKNLNFPKDLIAEIAKNTNKDNLELAECLCTDVSLNISPSLIPDILQNSSGISSEAIIKAINTGYLNKYPILAKYPADCWENIVKKNLLKYINDSSSISKDLVVLYAKSRNYNLIELHNRLVADALLNKDILKSGINDLTDSEIKEEMSSLNAAQTIDLIGLGNTEAAFPLMIDEFGEFIDEVAELSNKALSHNNVELLRQMINPQRSERCQKLNDEITELKKKLNEIVGADNLARIKELQAQKAQIDEQIKQLKQNKNAETPDVKQKVKDLQKQSKALGSQAQSIYYQSENAAQVKEIMKNISNKQKELKVLLQQNSGIEPQEVVTKLRVLYALTEISSEEEMAAFINMIKPSSPENDAVWNEAVNRKIYQKLGVEYDEELSRKLDLIHCKYISKLFVSSHGFFTNMRILVEIVKSNPNLTIEQAIDQMPQNIKTKRIFEELGFDYEKFTKVDKNSYAAIKIQLNAEEAKQAAIHNLEEDLNDALFQSLPKEVTEPIFQQLKEQLGVTFEKSQRDNWVGDGFSAGTTEYYRLYRDGKVITFEDMNDIVSVIKKEINSNNFWTKTHNDPQIDNARGTMYTHLIKMRTQEVDNASSIKDGETAEIEVRKTNMYDIKKALGLGNDAQCCTELGRNFNEWSAPTYIMNKCIGAIELTDKGNYVGNTMIYLAYVDGKPALVLDNIELKTKYQNNDKIRDTFLDYAKKFCAEIGQPDLPIFAGPNRHKLIMDIYDKSIHTMEIIGNSGNQKVYIDYDACGHFVGQGDKANIEMYRLN